VIVESTIELAHALDLRVVAEGVEDADALALRAPHALVAFGQKLRELGGEIALVFGPDRLMTSLDMKGLSVSLLPIDDQL